MNVSTIISVAALLLVLQSSIIAQSGSIAKSPTETKPLKVGDQVPKLNVLNPKGEEVDLASLHEKQPVVLVFFRGGWCPICSRHTQQLMNAYPDIKELGADLVGISPDSPASSQANVDKDTIPFPILSDADVAAAKAFGLAFTVDDPTIERYKGYGIDLEKASGRDHHALPIPAVFVINTDGKIVFAHSDADYRNRLDVKTIIKELEKLN